MATARVVEFQAARGAQFSDKEARRYGKYLYSKLGLGSRVVPAEVVLKAAEPENSPLHDAFQWDDSQAAHAYRLVQAQHLISHIVINVPVGDNGTETSVRAFHHVTEITESGVVAGYVSERVVWERPDFAVQVKAKALRELRGWRDRYRTYEELAWAAERVGQVVEEMEAA